MMAQFFRRQKRHFLLTPSQILVASFVSLCLAGMLLLRLPQAAADTPLSWIDAFFTATSASCVTGLIVVDTVSSFTLFGEIVILGLIQLGGLGIMTFSIFFLYLVEGRFSLGNRDLLQEIFTQEPAANLKAILKTVLGTTLMIELLGALLLMGRFRQEMPIEKALYYGIFHSVSAFCNAGFSLFPDSFISYQNDPLVNMTLAVLITFGSLGFIVMFEISRVKPLRFNKLSLHSKLVLSMSGGLIGGGALLFYLLEQNNALQGLPWHTQVLTSLFQSVTTRTAGFNTLDFGGFSNPTLLVMIVLMAIGASPGSCGGGIKTTTFAVTLAMIKARFQNQEDVSLFYRRIPAQYLSKAISVTFFFSILVVLFTLLLSLSEASGSARPEDRGIFLELLFEVTSALATAGLSTGLTAELSPTGRIIVALLMLIGRLGPLTIVMAVSQRTPLPFKYAKEKVLIG